MRHPLYKSILISTHAPLARCDKTVPQLRLFLSDFYSRTSCEVRQICANKPKKYKGFLLTHLLRGATYEGSFCSLRSQISTHAPLRGATDTCAFPKPQDKISTHAPLRGATRGMIRELKLLTFLLTRLCEARLVAIQFAAQEIISTHAPLRGATSSPNLVDMSL